MQPDSPIIISQRIGKKGKGQLSRSAPAVSPAKSGRGMVEQVHPQRQRLGFLAIADRHNRLSCDRLTDKECLFPYQSVGFIELCCAMEPSRPQ